MAMAAVGLAIWSARRPVLASGLENLVRKLSDELNAANQRIEELERRVVQLEAELKQSKGDYENISRENEGLRATLTWLMGTSAMTGQAVSLVTRVRETITKRLSADEVRTLATDLGVDYESLAGEGHAAKVRSLVEHLIKRNDLGTLIETLRRGRPDIVIGPIDAR
jgi:hypothetical protein